MTGYDGYLLYLGLKLHFSPGKYDFFKYCGRVKTNPQQFDLRKDRYFFHKLVRKYPDKDTLTFFLASNFFSRKVVWVRDLLTEEAHEVYLERLRLKESLGYTVSQDCKKLDINFSRMMKLLTVTNGEYPLLLQAAAQGDIHDETFIVLNAVIGFLPVWEKKLTDTILFPDFKHKCIRYQPFLGIDVKKFEKMLKERLTNV